MPDVIVNKNGVFIDTHVRYRTISDNLSKQEYKFLLTTTLTISETARKRAGLTQEQVAEQVDITPRFLMGLEKGEKRPSLEVLLRLAHLLNIPGDALIHPQLSFVDKEDQELLRLFMELTARDKKVILAAVHEMLGHSHTEK